MTRKGHKPFRRCANCRDKIYGKEKLCAECKQMLYGGKTAQQNREAAAAGGES